jgi:hypothetical protein
MDNNPEEKKPALVINVASWWTPILAIVMLVLGLAGGYLIRAAPPTETAGSTASPTAVALAETATPQPTISAEERQQMMDFVISKTRHFKGDPNAPVTLIEFSDFQ